MVPHSRYFYQLWMDDGWKGILRDSRFEPFFLLPAFYCFRFDFLRNLGDHHKRSSFGVDVGEQQFYPLCGKRNLF